MLRTNRKRVQTHLILATFFHFALATAWADKEFENPLEALGIRAEHRAFIDAMLREPLAGPTAFRQILETGRATVTRDGRTRNFVCDREREPDYCNKIVAWICQHANAERHLGGKLGEDVPASHLATTVLNGFLPTPEQAAEELYESGLATLRAPAVPPAPRFAQEFGARVGHLRQEMINRDNATAANRAFLRSNANAVVLAHSDAMTAMRLMALVPQPNPPPNPTPEEMLQEAQARSEAFTDAIQHDLMQAYGRIPAFGLSVAQDGKVYVSFEITTALGDSGRVVAELATGNPQAPGGPTLRPISFQPNFPVRVSMRAVSARYACYYGSRGLPTWPDHIELQPIYVQMPDEDPFVAFQESRKSSSNLIFPKEQIRPWLMSYVATEPEFRPGTRRHPIEIRLRKQKDFAEGILQAPGQGQAAPAPVKPNPPAAAPVAAPGTH